MILSEFRREQLRTSMLAQKQHRSPPEGHRTNDRRRHTDPDSSSCIRPMSDEQTVPCVSTRFNQQDGNIQKLVRSTGQANKNLTGSSNGQYTCKWYHTVHDRHWVFSRYSTPPDSTTLLQLPADQNSREVMLESSSSQLISTLNHMLTTKPTQWHGYNTSPKH